MSSFIFDLKEDRGSVRPATTEPGQYARCRRRGGRRVCRAHLPRLPLRHHHSARVPVPRGKGFVRLTELQSLVAVREGCRQDHGEALLGRPWSGAVERRVQRVILHVDPARAHAVALYRKSGRRSISHGRQGYTIVGGHAANWIRLTARATRVKQGGSGETSFCAASWFRRSATPLRQALAK